MSVLTIATRTEWSEQSNNILKQIQYNQLNINDQFPNKEHLQTKEEVQDSMNDNFQKFFSYPQNKLVSIEQISNLLKNASRQNISDNDNLFSQQKKKHQTSLMLQQRVKEFLASAKKSYREIKSIMAELQSNGVMFLETTGLKELLDMNRKVEVALYSDEINMELLQESIKFVDKNKDKVDIYFQEACKEKISVIKEYNDKFISILNKKTLDLEDFYNVKTLIEKSIKASIRVSNFDQLNTLKYSFQWILDLKEFLSINETSDDQKFNILTKERFANMLEINHTKERKQEKFSFDQSIFQISKFIEEVFNKKDVEFLKCLLKPVESVIITDSRIKILINSLEVYIWRYDVENRLSEQEICLNDLIALRNSAPDGIQQSSIGYEALRYITDKINEVETVFSSMIKIKGDLLKFINEMDQYKISMIGSQTRLQETKEKFSELISVIDEKLQVVKEFRETTGDSVKINRLLEFLETCLKMSNQESILIPEILSGQDMINSGELFDVRKSNLVQNFQINALKYKEFIDYFELIEKKERPGDITDYGISEFYNFALNFPKGDFAKQILRELEGGNYKLIDFSSKIQGLKSELETNSEWCNSIQSFIDSYKIEDLMKKIDKEMLIKINQTLVSLKRSFFDHSFSCEILHELWSFEWSIDTLKMVFISDKKKVADWQKRFENANELKVLPAEQINFIKDEIALAEKLILGGRNIFKSKIMLESLKDMTEKLESCRIDLSDECNHLFENYQKADNLNDRINRFLDKEDKLRLHEIDKILDEIKESCIDFENAEQEIEKMLQICKAFTVAIKEMKKTPTELKKARHTYQQLPLNSPNFEIMIKQMDDEEKLLDEIDSIDVNIFKNMNFDELLEIEDKLFKAKFYDVLDAKIKVFKIKVKILREESLSASIANSTKAFIPYASLKKMTLEVEEYLKIYEDDHELNVLERFLKDADSVCQGHLKNFASVKNAATLEKVKNVIMNFVDISAEVKDIQIRIKMNEGNTTSLGFTKRVDPFLNQRVGTVSKNVIQNKKTFDLGLGVKPTLNVERERKPVVENTRMYEDVELPRKNLVNSIPIQRIKEVQNFRESERKPQVNYEKIRIQKFDRDEEGDIISSSFKANRKTNTERIREEMQKNPTIYLGNIDLNVISANIEKQFWNRYDEEDYEIKIRQAIRFIKCLMGFKKLCFLIVKKNFEFLFMEYLMTKKLSELKELEDNKDKLVEAINYIQKMKTENQNLKKRAPDEQDPIMIKRQKKSGMESEDLLRNKLSSNNIDDSRLQQNQNSAKKIDEQKNLQNPQGAKNKRHSDKINALLQCRGDIIKSGISGCFKDGNFVSTKNQGENNGIKAMDIQINNTKSNNDQNKSRLDDILKNADKVVESVRMSLKTMAGNDKIDSSVDEEVIDETSANDSAFAQGLFQSQASRLKQFTNNTGASAHTIYRGRSSVNISGAEVNQDNCSFISFDQENSLRKVVSLPKDFKTKATATFPEFLDHVNRLSKKQKTKPEDHSMNIGYVEMGINQMIQGKLMKLFQTQKRVPYIKYSNFSKLFIIPKGLLTEKWSMPFKNQVKKIMGVTSEIVWLILFNKSKQNEADILSNPTNFVNPMPVKQINWRNEPIEIDENGQGLNSKIAIETLTPVSSDDEFSNQPVQRQNMQRNTFGNVLNNISDLGTSSYANNNTNLFKKDPNLLDFLKQGPSYNDSDKFALGANDYGNHYMNSVGDMPSGLISKLSDNLNTSQINTNPHLGFAKKDNKNDLLKTQNSNVEEFKLMHNLSKNYMSNGFYNKKSETSQVNNVQNAPSLAQNVNQFLDHDKNKSSLSNLVNKMHHANNSYEEIVIESNDNSFEQMNQNPRFLEKNQMLGAHKKSSSMGLESLVKPKNNDMNAFIPKQKSGANLLNQSLGQPNGNMHNHNAYIQQKNQNRDPHYNPTVNRDVQKSSFHELDPFSKAQVLAQQQKKLAMNMPPINQASKKLKKVVKQTQIQPTNNQRQVQQMNNQQQLPVMNILNKQAEKLKLENAMQLEKQLKMQGVKQNIAQKANALKMQQTNMQKQQQKLALSIQNMQAVKKNPEGPRQQDSLQLALSGQNRSVNPNPNSNTRLQQQIPQGGNIQNVKPSLYENHQRDNNFNAKRDHVVQNNSLKPNNMLQNTQKMNAEAGKNLVDKRNNVISSLARNKSQNKNLF